MSKDFKIHVCTQKRSSHESILSKERHKLSSTCCNCHKAAAHWHQPRMSRVKGTCQQKQRAMQTALFPRAMSLGLGRCALEGVFTWGRLYSAQANEKWQNPRVLRNDSQLTWNTACIVGSNSSTSVSRKDSYEQPYQPLRHHKSPLFHSQLYHVASHILFLVNSP